MDFQMSLRDRIDICESMYGKLKKARGYFYWTDDKLNLIDVRSGENLTSHVWDGTRSRWRDKWNLSQKLQLKRDIIVLIDKNNETVIYDNNTNPILKLKWEADLRHIKEILYNNHRNALISLDNLNSDKPKKVINYNIVTKEIIHMYVNISRVYIEETHVDLVIFENNTFKRVRFDY